MLGVWLLTFVGRGVDVLLHHPGDLVVQYHGIQSPALVGAGNLLSHGSQETLHRNTVSHIFSHDAQYSNLHHLLMLFKNHVVNFLTKQVVISIQNTL